MKIFRLYIIKVIKPEQKCSGFYMQKVNTSKGDVESEEENESYQSTKYERRSSQVIYGGKYGI